MFTVTFADGHHVTVTAATAEQARGRAYRLSPEPVIEVTTA